MGAPVVSGNDGGVCRRGGGGDGRGGSQELGQGEAGGEDGPTAGSEQGAAAGSCHWRTRSRTLAWECGVGMWNGNVAWECGMEIKLHVGICLSILFT